MKVKTSLSIADVTAAIKQVEHIKTALYNKVIPLFMRKTTEWLKVRARYYLESSGQDMPIIQGIEHGFKIVKITSSFWKLINTNDKAVYIEFGVGATGEGSHPEASNTAYRYNMPSDGKTADGKWYFKGNLAKGIDISPNNREMALFVGGKGGKSLVVGTHGQKGELYMYNSIVDYMSSGQYQVLFQESWNEILG